ncbi:HdeD family acid-resistance protein [Dyadobacter psychrotolerans]|uniref:HdeD family acid-resistance protein n=1 Tax=Dyadobacter psychrotolerans TaxID=2541721 RepID=A0A4R5D437_9BACT|nr:DUF308 domain-containing protein [Dyadobacter psychrotolerans]TDE08162.1 hypothetical protein E0F88_33130 [Dyadobacter psychrotolerans]
MKTFNSLSRQLFQFWWTFLFPGSGLILLGIYVLVQPEMQLAALSLYLCVAFLINGIFEILVTITNKKMVNGRKWYLAGGVLDLLVAGIFISNPILATASVPLLVGFWLLLRSLAMIGRSYELKQIGLMHWEWLLYFGFTGLLFYWVNIYSQLFATKIIITWTGIAISMAGVFYIYYSICLKSTTNTLDNTKI